MTTLRKIFRFLRVVWRIAVGICPECGGKLGDTDDGMSMEYEHCECCDNGTVRTRREVIRRVRIRW